MFTDPISVTYGGAAKSLPRTGNDEDSSLYNFVDTGNVTFTVKLSHKFEKRNRCVARIERSAYVANPENPAQNLLEQAAVTVTADWAPTHVPADAQALFMALKTFLSDANFLKLAGGEL